MMNAPLRLALYVPSMRGGGAEHTTLKLACGMARQGYAVDLVLAQAEGPYLAQVPESVRVIDLKAPRVLFSLPGLVQYLRREQPQAMLAVLNHANIVALWAQRLAQVSTRLVVSERNTLFARPPGHLRASHWLIPLLIKYCYPWADGIVAVSQSVAKDLVQQIGLPRDRIQVIYNPVVTPELHQKTQAPLDHPWFEPGQPPVILAVGRFTPQKDFPTLLRAFAQLRQTQPARLLILGEGIDRPKLEALVAELELETDVSLPGFVANPWAYMARAALFVLPSRWEGLPGVLIEALYCGTPLIATDCPGGSREILNGGQYGILIPVGDVAALSQAMITVLKDGHPSPPAASWYPFEEQTIVDQYLNILMGNADGEA